jgi:hypothetical protein
VEDQMTNALKPCDHHWVIPRFGEEDERVCSKCRVTAEEVTRAEDAPRQTEGDDALVGRVAEAIGKQAEMYDVLLDGEEIAFAKAALQAAMLTTSPRQTDPLGDGSDYGVTGEWWGTSPRQTEGLVDRIASIIALRTKGLYFGTNSPSSVAHEIAALLNPGGKP